MTPAEHTLTFEHEAIEDHGVPVDHNGDPSGFVMRRPTGRCFCSCGWQGSSTEAREHVEVIREAARGASDD